MAGKKNIEIVKRKTLRERFQLLDGTPSTNIITEESVAADILAGVLTPKNIVGATFSAKAQKAGSTDASTVITFSVTVIDEPNAIIEISYLHTQTASIAWTNGVWDLTITYAGGDSVIELEGNVNATKAVS